MDTRKKEITMDRFKRGAGKFSRGIRVVSVVSVVAALSASTSGCYVARATGETFEAVGVGMGRALGGVSQGVGHVVAGTGRAVTRAASGNQGPAPRSVSADADLVSDDSRDFRF
jgi:hypothetical protein